MKSFKPVDLNADAIALLTQAGLPTADLGGDGVVSFCGMWEGDQLCGLVGVELHGRVGLLRSLVVSPACRGCGQGEVLVGKAEALAREASIDVLYLMTVSSGRLFERCGFVHIGRDEVPAAIRETKQFSSLCPATCAVMRKRI